MCIGTLSGEVITLFSIFALFFVGGGGRGEGGEREFALWEANSFFLELVPF